MMKTRVRTLILLAVLCFAAGAFGGRLSFEEHAAVQESLARVHPRMRASWLKERGIEDPYYTSVRTTSESTGLRCIGRWPWGPSWELAGRDTFLYLGSGSGVRILSIADSVQPRMLGQVNARGLVCQVVVQDSLLFVACGSWGAQIYSVSDPTNPRELGSMDAVIGDICVKDTFCYTIGGDSFRIYSVASPSQPSLVGVVRDSGDVIAEANGYAYVGCGSSGTALNVYDVRDPHSPTLVNTLGGVQLALFARGNLLFRTSVQPSYFSILDISNPSSVHEVGRINGYGGLALFADDRYAYLSCTYDHRGLFVIDISDSTNPRLRDSLKTEGDGVYDLYVPRPESYGYVAAHYGGLVSIDFHDADSISELWSGYKAHQALDVCVDGNLAYVADQCAGLRILGITDPTRPQTLGEYDTVGVLDVRSAVARDSFAFISWWGNNRRFLRVLDVTIPAEPTFAAEESCFNNPNDWVLRDSLLYAAEANRFQVFTVARPREPVLVGSCVIQDGVFGLVVQDTLAYVAGVSLQVVSVANPANPVVISSGGRPSIGIAVSDTFAYIPSFDTLFVYSVANPSQPRMLSATPTGRSWDVVLCDSLLFVGTSAGVEAYDISNPVEPREIGVATAPYSNRRLYHDGRHLYAALWEAGVAVYETTATGIAESGGPIEPTSNPLRAVPNPVSSRVRIIGAARAARVLVYDAVGRAVGIEAATSKGSAVELNMAGLRSGVYFVEVAGHPRTEVLRIVKP